MDPSALVLGAGAREVEMVDWHVRARRGQEQGARRGRQPARLHLIRPVINNGDWTYAGIAQGQQWQSSCSPALETNHQRNACKTQVRKTDMPICVPCAAVRAVLGVGVGNCVGIAHGTVHVEASVALRAEGDGCGMNARARPHVGQTYFFFNPAGVGVPRVLLPVLRVPEAFAVVGEVEETEVGQWVRAVGDSDISASSAAK